MPLYMDVHTIEGGAPADKTLHLVKAPQADTAQNVHRQAHGLVADELFEVREEL